MAGIYSEAFMIGFDVTSSNSMDITESFRPEDLSKTDFFDFVTAPDLGIALDRPPGESGSNSEQPLQGYDQVIGYHLLYFLIKF